MLKKMILFIILLSYTGNVFAHPLDVSNSTIGIKDNKVNMTTYFHSFEIDYLLKLNGIEIKSIEDYFNNKNIISQYITNNISFKNNNKDCIIKDFEFYKDEIYTILTDGFKVSYKIKCEKDINNFKLELNFFTNFPLQTNKIIVYNLNNGINSIIYKVLTPKINYLKINDLKNFKSQKQIDSDCDNLGDEDEKVYKTDIYKVDTDGDNYTDYEEIIGGWNPLNPEYGPGQIYKEKLISIKCEINQDINKTIKKQSNIITKSINSLDSNGYGTNYLKEILKYISNYINKNEGNLLYIFIIVYTLGIVHAIGPGHSKSLIIAYTIEKENGYKKGLLYALIFSISHILDILILFGITTIAFQYIDVAKYNYYIQVVSIGILFLLSIYLVYRSFFRKQECNTKKHSTLYIAFLSGLAPCSFAWSIYFLLLSLGKLSYIIPLIIALGLGILTTLSAIVLITVFIKEKSLNKTKVLAKYSSKISAILILIISLILLINTINL